MSRVDDEARSEAAKPEQIRSLFDRVALRYDLANHVLSCGVDYYWRRRAVSVCSVGPGEEMLDMCCGTGDLTFTYARSEPEAKIVGCDFSGEMVEVARAKGTSLVDEGKLVAGQAEWVVGDCTDTGFEGGKFNLITCAFGVRNMQASLGRAVGEMYRLLAEGEHVCILEFSLPRFVLIRWAYMFYLCMVLPILGGLITGRFTSYRYLSKTICYWSKNVDLPGALREAGFRDVKSIPISLGVVTITLACR